MRTARVFTGWALAVAAIVAGLAYIGDSLYIRHKMAAADSSQAFGTVRFYPATQLKNGKLDIYLESPQNETCIHALFPHYGYNPCWYAKRNTVRVVASVADRERGWASDLNSKAKSQQEAT